MKLSGRAGAGMGWSDFVSPLSVSGAPEFLTRLTSRGATGALRIWILDGLSWGFMRDPGRYTNPNPIPEKKMVEIAPAPRGP